jgi:hypothetical protein
MKAISSGQPPLFDACSVTEIRAGGGVMLDCELQHQLQEHLALHVCSPDETE